MHTNLYIYTHIQEYSAYIFLCIRVQINIQISTHAHKNAHKRTYTHIQHAVDKNLPFHNLNVTLAHGFVLSSTQFSIVSWVVSVRKLKQHDYILSSFYLERICCTDWHLRRISYTNISMGLDTNERIR